MSSKRFTAEIDGLFRAALPELRALRRLRFELVVHPVAATGDTSAPPSSTDREGSRPTAPGGACGSPGTVDVNRADESELDQLPGIGPVLAGRIVAERETNGPFSGYLDLQRVRGIGPKTAEGLRGLACAGN